MHIQHDDFENRVKITKMYSTLHTVPVRWYRCKFDPYPSVSSGDNVYKGRFCLIFDNLLSALVVKAYQLYIKREPNPPVWA